MIGEDADDAEVDFDEVDPEDAPPSEGAWRHCCEAPRTKKLAVITLPAAA